MRILNVVSTRPNAVKMAPLMRAMRRRPGVTPILVHTGHHQDGSTAAATAERIVSLLADALAGDPRG
jgi:UDP-N-acetylglucosamine 2-epimerase (non-hydrolysing)